MLLTATYDTDKIMLLCCCVALGNHITNSTLTRPVACGFQQQQPSYVPVVQQLSPFCSNSLNSSSVIPGVVPYPNPLLAPVNQLPSFTQVPPPTLQWVDTSRQAFIPPNGCVHIVPGVNVPKVDYAGSVILPSAKLNWPVSDRKPKVISAIHFLHFILCTSYMAL